jgi:hypothetical protein
VSFGIGRLARPKGDEEDPRRVIAVRPGAQVAARIGLWSLVGLGALGGTLGLLRPAAQQAARADGSGQVEIVPPEMAGFAELAVTTWLEAGEDDEAAVDALFAVDPSTDAGDSGRRRADGAATVAARSVGTGYWAVTVAVQVDELVGERQWRSAGTWFLEVGIAADDDGVLMAVSEPAVVPAPDEPGQAPRPAGGGLGTPAGDHEDMAATVEGFLGALVAGDGDVSRYLAPDVDIRSVTPAPFVEVNLQRWSVSELSDDEARVRLVARGTSEAGVPRTVSYQLVLAEREGRWEVTSISGAPVLDGQEDDDPAGGGASTSPTTATATTAEPGTTSTVSIASEPGA